MHAILPHVFQKYRTIKTKARSRVFLLSNVFMKVLVYNMVFFCGLACFAYFYDCDPRFTGEIDNKNQLTSLWFIRSINDIAPSLAGIFLSAIVCWALITHSNGLLICFNVMNNDILEQMSFARSLLERFVGQNSKPLKKWLFKVILLTIFGSISIIYAIGLLYTERSIIALFFLFSNSLNSNILGLFLLAIFNPYANFVGVSIGFICGVSLNCWLGIGSAAFAKLISQELPLNSFNCQANLSQAFVSKLNDYLYSPTDPGLFNFYSISQIWYCQFGMSTTFIVGSLASIIYSLIKSGKLDYLSEEKAIERRKYLFSFKNLKIR